MGRVEDMVQGDCQFDNAESGTQMPTGDGYRVQHFLSQFLSELRQLLIRQCAQVSRDIDLIQKGRLDGQYLFFRINRPKVAGHSSMCRQPLRGFRGKNAVRNPKLSVCAAPDCPISQVQKVEPALGMPNISLCSHKNTCRLVQWLRALCGAISTYSDLFHLVFCSFE